MLDYAFIFLLNLPFVVSGALLGELHLETETLLEQVRSVMNDMTTESRRGLVDNVAPISLSDQWCFLDCET